MPTANNSNQSAAMQAAQMNAAQRALLINTGLFMVKKLQPATAAALGQSMRINLERVGVTTGVILEFTVPVNVTAAATQSPFGPYNLASLLSYTDFAGLQRVLTSGYLLHVLNCFKGARFVDNSHKLGQYLTVAETGLDTNLLSVPVATGQGTISFSLYVPMAYDPMADLRGAVLAQTIYGDHYITVNLPNAFVNADGYTAPYTAGTVALGTNNGGVITVQAYQQYIMPQQGVTNLPMIDLSTIYAVEGNYTDNSNIAAGQSKFLNWPNNRAVMSTTHVFDNGGSGVANGADLSGITLLGNSNTNIREMTPSYVRRGMRYQLGADLAAGVYFLSSRHQPITTQLFGNVQTKFDIASVNSDPYFVSQYESTYLSGTPLPGIVQ